MPCKNSRFVGGVRLCQYIIDAHGALTRRQPNTGKDTYAFGANNDHHTRIRIFNIMFVRSYVHYNIMALYIHII